MALFEKSRVQATLHKLERAVSGVAPVHWLFAEPLITSARSCVDSVNDAIINTHWKHRVRGEKPAQSAVGGKRHGRECFNQCKHISPRLSWIIPERIFFASVDIQMTTFFCVIQNKRTVLVS